jgi:YebC/PmpR family DNA-binding regulatory protein
MSGHSKWATIKHKKGAQDKARGKLFAKLIRQVEVAAREGGGDVNSNATLRTMFQKARDASVPMDTIERAVKRGTGELEGVRYETVSYEGYAPAGVAMIIECLTDNRNRTGADVRHAFNKHGGSLGEPGSVAYLFDKAGVIIVDASRYDEDGLMVAIDAGAQDIALDDDVYEIVTAPSDLVAVRDALREAGIEFESAELTQRPKTRVPLDEDAAVKLMKLIDALEESDDVGEVHANFDVDADVLQRMAS